MNKLSLLLITSLAMVSNSLYAGTYTIASSTRGWVNSAGEGNGSDNDNNTNVGIDPFDSGKSYISWAYFDLSPLIGAGTVTHVSLAGSIVPINGTDKPYTVLGGGANIPLTTLANYDPGVHVYNQLENGNGYGSYVGLFAGSGYGNTTYDFEIFGNIHIDVPSAIAAGGSFIMTFQKDELYLYPEANPDGFYGPTGWAQIKGPNIYSDYPTLTITTVPVPGAFALMFSAIGLLGLRSRRKKEN